MDECDAAAEMLKSSIERNEEMANDLIRAVTSSSDVLVRYLINKDEKTKLIYSKNAIKSMVPQMFDKKNFRKQRQ